ncbi:MAG: SufE family protein [Bacteroidales bacterium]|jgi:cysteine desulfuration protein SufE|nr:SufE family protein [Bacteroidales bacterium]
MTIQEEENKVIEEFSIFDDWMDKYNYIIELGNALPLMDEKYKQEPYLIAGCQSNVWLQAELTDGKIYFKADSDAIITKGIISLLIRILSGRTPDEIIDASLSFLDTIGLTQHLSPTRSNGLLSMIKQIKVYAMAFKTKINQNDR